MAIIDNGPLAPACPRCGGFRTRVQRTNRAAYQLQWVCFLVTILCIAGCLATGEGACAVIGGVAMVGCCVSAVVVHASRKSYYVCAACDEAQPAPPRASEL